MKVVRKYREILIGGSRFAELKGRKTSLEELFSLSMDQPDFRGNQQEIFE